METEFIKPSGSPKRGAHGFSPFGSFLAAAGAALLTASLLGSAAAASAWAIVKLMGLPDTLLFGALAVFAIPVAIFSIWIMGRAWHVERRLAQGLDIDTPVFKTLHYLKKR